MRGETRGTHETAGGTAFTFPAAAAAAGRRPHRGMDCLKSNPWWLKTDGDGGQSRAAPIACTQLRVSNSMARNEQLGISTSQAFEVVCPVELAVAVRYLSNLNTLLASRGPGEPCCARRRTSVAARSRMRCSRWFCARRPRQRVAQRTAAVARGAFAWSRGVSRPAPPSGLILTVLPGSAARSAPALRLPLHDSDFIVLLASLLHHVGTGARDASSPPPTCRTGWRRW